MAGASNELTDREAEIYDRQIRLWGVDAQKRLRTSQILIAGLNGLGAEVSKNVTLAGMNVVVADDAVVVERHLSSNFFVRADNVGANRATASLPAIKELNPLVAVTADPRNVASFTDDELAGFKNGCVILCDVDTAAAIQIAERCHRLTVPVFLATSFGFSSFFFADLGSHSALITTVKSKAGGEAETTTVQKVIEFKSLQQALSTSWRDLKPKTTMPAVYPWIALHRAVLDGSLSKEASQEEAAAAVFAQAEACCAAAGVDVAAYTTPAACADLVRQRGLELSPVCATVGGMLGSEVIKLISGKDMPIHNLFSFDSMGGWGGLVVSL